MVNTGAATAEGRERPETRPLVTARALTKFFPVSQGWFSRQKSFVHAVDNVSFDLMAGESLGLVGESGCGKTTTGKMLVRLIDPTSGHIIFDDRSGQQEDIATLKGGALKAFRRKAQMVHHLSGPVRVPESKTDCFRRHIRTTQCAAHRWACRAS